MEMHPCSAQCMRQSCNSFPYFPAHIRHLGALQEYIYHSLHAPAIEAHSIVYEIVVQYPTQGLYRKTVQYFKLDTSLPVVLSSSNGWKNNRPTVLCASLRHYHGYQRDQGACRCMRPCENLMTNLIQQIMAVDELCYLQDGQRVVMYCPHPLVDTFQTKCFLSLLQETQGHGHRPILSSYCVTRVELPSPSRSGWNAYASMQTGLLEQGGNLGLDLKVRLYGSIAVIQYVMLQIYVLLILFYFL